MPVYTAELQEDDARGTALAQEFQANILGLNMAFILNVCLTHNLSKLNQWAWRVPIIGMQIFPVLLASAATFLPETPRWYVLNSKDDKAKRAIGKVFGEDQVESRFTELNEANKKEQEEGRIGWLDMLMPSGSQFHPTVVTVMGQVNQALTGYGAVSVYGPQIFQLLGFGVTISEYITLGNYIFYFLMMTFAWILIDTKGRRWLMVYGAEWLAVSFAILTVLGGLAMSRNKLGIPLAATGVPGIIVLYLATAAFGIGWLVPPWLVPTEIYPSTARAQGAAISVIIWGFSNFAVTLLTPLGFNKLKYWLFLVFCITNAFAGWWTWAYCPESGNRTFEENQEFFREAEKKGSWRVRKIQNGTYTILPDHDEETDVEEDTAEGLQHQRREQVKPDAHAETEPLLGRTSSSGR